MRVDPNNSNNVAAGTKTGLYLSYDGGTNWTGPCTTNNFTTQRQDITGLELSNFSGTTRILAAVGTRGFATTVQYNLDQNGANGIYKGTIPASGCPSDFTSIASNANGFVFGTHGDRQPLRDRRDHECGQRRPLLVSFDDRNQLGRIDIAVAPSNPNVIYAQVQSIAERTANCGGGPGCQLGVWATTNGGTSWTFMTGSAGGSLRNCLGTNTSGNPGDYPQNWYDQGMAVDPNNPDRLFIDTYDVWLATRTGSSFTDVTCGYNGGERACRPRRPARPSFPARLVQHSDGRAAMAASSSPTNANTASSAPPEHVNMDNGINTIEFYSGDISGNFATSPNPSAAGGAQDNAPSVVGFTGYPTGPAQWQMTVGGDGFFARIDPVGTGSSPRYFVGNNSGGMNAA